MPYPHGKGSKSITVISKTSTLCAIIWAHWNEVGIKLLPVHFEKYFSWNTLGFWRMRNGQCKGNRYIIGVSRLTKSDKLRLINVLKDKLELKSKLTINDTKLSIFEPERVIKNIQPMFHESQLFRLNRTS